MVSPQIWAHMTDSTDLVLVDSGCLVDVKMSETSEAWLPLKADENASFISVVSEGSRDVLTHDPIMQPLIPNQEKLYF